MKVGVSHLPKAKQAELETILQIILDIAKPVMVILFGSYGRGDFVEDKYVEKGTTYEYKSDYDLLIIAEKERELIIGNSKRIKKRIRRSGVVDTPVGLIFHSIDFVNEELSSGSYFFMDVVKDGAMLFTDGRFQLAEPRVLSVEEKRMKAEEYFAVWFKEAKGFFKMFEIGKAEGLNNHAIFMLHQAAERFYDTLLLVINDYKPKIHDLDELHYQARIIDSRFKSVFPRGNEEEERLFMLLKKAYIDARYKSGYVISEADIAYLAERVSVLRDLTEEVCLNRLKN